MLWEVCKIFVSLNSNRNTINAVTTNGFFSRSAVRSPEPQRAGNGAFWRIFHWIAELSTSVADPGCLSRIPDPDFYPSRIPDPKTATKDRGEKNFFCQTMLKKKIWTNFPRIIEVFTQKIVTKPSKTWVWDPGSRGQKGTGSRILDPDPQHCSQQNQPYTPADLQNCG